MLSAPPHFHFGQTNRTPEFLRKFPAGKVSGEGGRGLRSWPPKWREDAITLNMTSIFKRELSTFSSIVMIFKNIYFELQIFTKLRIMVG